MGEEKTMKTIQQFVAIFFNQKIYHTYSSSRGSGIVFELRYKKQIFTVNIIYVLTFVITTTEICSKNPVSPVSSKSVQLLFDDINKYKTSYKWYLDNYGFYFLRSTFNYDWFDSKRYPKVVKFMCKKFSSLSAYIEDLGHGRKTYQNVYNELWQKGLIK